MDIDTGDSPPISQKLCTLPLKHITWVKKLQILEKNGIFVQSVSPWASPIVVVPKNTAPGKPPRRKRCVGYRDVSTLLPPVMKTHSKAKGILTVVISPK